MNKTAREVIADTFRVEFWSEDGGAGTDEYQRGRFSDAAQAALDALDAAGFVIVKKVEPGEASRPGFDMRSYEVGYIDGGNNALADPDFVLVPKEPTAEMLSEGMRDITGADPSVIGVTDERALELRREEAGHCYRAMIAKAQEP